MNGDNAGKVHGRPGNVPPAIPFITRGFVAKYYFTVHRLPEMSVRMQRIITRIVSSSQTYLAQLITSPTIVFSVLKIGCRLKICPEARTRIMATSSGLRHIKHLAGCCVIP